MKCKKTDTAIMGYLFGTQPAQSREGMKKHIKACPDCRTRLDRFGRTKTLLNSLPDPEPPQGLAKKVLRSIGLQQGDSKIEVRGKTAADIPFEGYIEALSKTACSEQMRVYQFLTRLLGVKKGEAAFEEYLQEQMRLSFTTGEGSVISYGDLINTATGERSQHRSRGDAVESTVEHCSFPRLAEEMGINNNPCETICRRQIKVVEKLKSVKIKCIKHRSHAGGGCVFQIKPAVKHS